jgi:uncharacterized membrane protein YebE (DUF533 family)
MPLKQERLRAMDFKTILADLQKQAKIAAKEYDLEKKMQRGKDLGAEALHKLKTDRTTQIATAGAAGLLMTALLGTKGGRKFLGGTAKTGAVAGLGVLAYRAWQQRQGAKAAADVKPAELGFVTDKKMEPEFAEALVRTMVAAAWADGNLDESERATIETALKNAGEDKKLRAVLANERPEAETLDKIAAGARSPNHSAQLFAAACLVTGEPTQSERGFLSRLAHRLGIEEGHAEAVRAQVAGL